LAKELDTQTGETLDAGFQDEYQLEDLEITSSDYVVKTQIARFQENWEQLGDEFEVVETYSLSTMKSLQAGVDEVISFLGMEPCENSAKVPGNKTKHILFLAGTFVGGPEPVPVMAQSRMKFVEGTGVQMELTVRSTNDDISTLVASSL